MCIINFITRIIGFIYQKTFLSFFVLITYNAIKGLPWRLAHLDWQITQVYSKHEDYAKLNSLLKKYFLISFKNSGFKFYSNFLSDKLNNKKINYYLIRIDKLESEISGLFLFKHINIYFQHFGSFQKSCIVRKYYKKKLIRSQFFLDYINLDAIRACLELNKLVTIENFFHTKKIKLLDKKNAKLLLQHAELLRTASNKNHINEKYCDEYFKLISNSSVIISGPLANKKKDTKNKKSIVIRINEIQKQEIGKIISYYNGNAVDQYSGQIVKSFRFLLYACTKSEMSKSFLQKQIQKKNSKVRVFFNANNLLLNNYGATGVQNVVYDLILHHPKNIYLKGVTFFLGKKLYPSYYLGPKLNIKNLAFSIKTHEPFSNFIFVKNLWKKKIIKASKQVEDILKLSELKYARRLDRQYKLT